MPGNFIYKGPVRIRDRVAILAGLFNLDYKDTFCYLDNCKPKSVYGAEGLFAIPRWQCVAETYAEATNKALSLLLGGQVFEPFYEFLPIDGNLSHNINEKRRNVECLEEGERKVSMIKRVCVSQDCNDILILPAQFNSKYIGKNPEQALNMLAWNEFGLGIFEIACMLLVCPRFLFAENDFNIICLGDQTGYCGNFNEFPVIFIRNQFIEVNTVLKNFSSKNNALATGFLFYCN